MDCQRLIQSPAMYATFMLWMISELFEVLPEMGDREKPKMVFFFDEAHLLFESAPKVLLDKLEQVVKLIRSKGVGIYFITQNPKDIPGGVLSQLGNKIQHALHAYTPAEQKSARAAAQAFRENPEFDTYETLAGLGIGEALISVLDEEGVPTIVKKCKILPPQSLMGAIEDEVRQGEIKGSLLYTRYSETFDRDSAYEFLMRKYTADEEEARKAAENAAEEERRMQEEKQRQKEEEERETQRKKEEAAAEKQKQKEAEAAEKARLKEELWEKNDSGMKRRQEKQRKRKSSQRTADEGGGRTCGRYGRRHHRKRAWKQHRQVLRRELRQKTGRQCGRFFRQRHFQHHVQKVNMCRR